MDRIYRVLRRPGLIALVSLVAQLSLVIPADSRSMNVRDTAARQAAVMHGVPPEHAVAITRTETGRAVSRMLFSWPSAAQSGKNGYWICHKDKATGFLRPSASNRNRNIDVDCFQTNIRRHGKNVASIDGLFDPLTKASIAENDLRDMRAETGHWLSDLAACHVPASDVAPRYLDRFRTVLADLSDRPAAQNSGSFFTLSRMTQGAAGIRSPGSPMPLDNRGETSPLIQIR